MTYQEKYQTWLDYAQLPDYLRQDLVSMDEKTKEDAFYTNLEFGTAGMRGYIGAGTNRINVYVVRQATEGLAKLVASKGDEAKKRGVAIAYDSRHFSPEFAFESAQVLAAHGIQSYVFEAQELDLMKLDAFMEALIEQYGNDMLRYKGVLAIHEKEHALIIQGVHKVVGFDYSDAPIRTRHSLLVIIARPLPYETLKQQFLDAQV